MLDALILYGAVASCVYTLLALGFTLIYGVSGIVNMAHGVFFLLGAYVYHVLSMALPTLLPTDFYYIALVLAMIITPIVMGIVGSIFYRLTLHQILGDEVAILVVSICGSLIVQQLILLLFGSNPVSLPPVVSGNISVWGVRIPSARVLAAIVSLMLYIGLWLFVSKTKIGRAMKALSQDYEAATLMGVSTEKLYMLTAAISGSLASVAGVLIISSTTRFALVGMWLHPLAISFAIVVLGGLGSIKGTLIGGFVFGYAEVIVARLLPRGGVIVPVVPFIVLLITLIIRPKGIFGKRVEMED